jgi:hypothetical protein
MKQTIVFLSAAITGVMLHSPSSHAAVLFTAGSGQVTPSESFSVPITVSGFTEVTSFQYSLAWDPAVLQFSSVGDFGLVYLTSGTFGTTETASGTLTVAWDDVDLAGKNLPDDSSIFNMNFTAVGGQGSSSFIWFTNVPTALEVTVDLVPVAFNSMDGSVNVVPEPINIALGAFAGLFVGASALRRVLNKRSAQPAS